MKRVVIVIGGGITGRLIQHVLPGIRVCDWSDPPARESQSLTRQFGTNYLWEPLPGLACRPFPVVTHVDHEPWTPASVAAYKQKIGKIGDDLTWGAQFLPETTGWDLIELPKSQIAYNMRAVSINPLSRRIVWSTGEIDTYDVLISTIPMYALISLMKEYLLGQELEQISKGKLRSDPIFVKVTARPPDAPYPPDILYVNYLSDPDVPVYRYCDRFGDRHYESIRPMAGSVIPTKKLIPGKIHAMPEEIRASMHMLLWQLGNIKCFGRYAQWDPEELVHNTFHQIVAFKKEMSW